MKKNRAKLMKRYTVAVVSVATALPTVAPAVPAFADESDDAAAESADAENQEGSKKIPQGSDSEDAKGAEETEGSTEGSEESKESDQDDEDQKASNAEADDEDKLDDVILEDGNVPTASKPEETEVAKEAEEAKKEDKALLDDLDLSAQAFAEYPEFGSAEFVEWLSGAYEEEIEEWYAAAKAFLNVDKGTSSDAEKAAIPFGTDAFWAWVYEDAAELKDSEWLYDMDAILAWMVDAGYEDAKAFMDEFFLSSNTLLAVAEYPEFGSAEFFEWLTGATEDQVRAWYDLNKKEDTEGATEEQLASYALAFDSDEFWEWATANCTDIIDEEAGTFSYRYDVIYDWICHVPFESVYQFLQCLMVNAQTSTFAAAGRLWPNNYGSTGNLYDDGRGTEENPYIIDSVADLRLFAVTIAQNPSRYNNNDVYYLIENGTYDLNGSWIPVGGALNPGDNPTAFLGHLACEKNVVIENFGFKSNTAIGITPDIVNGVIDQSHVGFGAWYPGMHKGCRKRVCRRPEPGYPGPLHLRQQRQPDPRIPAHCSHAYRGRQGSGPYDGLCAGQ